MNRISKISAFKYLACAVLAIPVAMLSACRPYAADRPTVHTTISTDGKMVATLVNAGTEQQMLHVRNLDTDTEWSEVTAPPLTQTIRFGLQGHELLLTHRRPEPPLKDYLSKMDLDHPDKGLQKLYEADELGFPVEVQPGQVMVRTHKSPYPTGEWLLGDHYWILVGPGQQVQKVGPERIMPYPAPSIVGDGFFWAISQTGKNDEAHPQLLRFALPGGRAPDISNERWEKNTWDVDCNRTATRCLRSFISNLEQGGAYIYDVEVMFGSQRCRLPGVAGFGTAPSITPDGNAAVMALASKYKMPRHVVVMRFKPQQCEAVSVQHIHFEEE